MKTTKTNFATATPKELAAIGFTFTTLKTKKANKGNTHYTR